MVIRALIFDYFGVIRPDGVTAAYAALGGDPDKDAQFIGDTIHALNLGMIASSRPVFAEKLGVSVETWTQEVTGRYQHDKKLLAYIEAKHKAYKVGLLSNIGPDGLKQLWPKGELEYYFDVAICSGDVGFMKPDARIYELMADRLGVEPEECIMIDDRATHVEGARATGMQAVQYENFTQGTAEIETLLNQS